MPCMSNHRRAAVPGAICFFSGALADRRSRALVEHVNAWRAAFVATAREHPVRVDAMGVLPVRLHAVWRLPEGDPDFPLRWRKMKSRVTRSVRGPAGRVGDSPTLGGWPRSASKIRKGERGLWRRRCWEHMIRDVEDLRRHVEYCWFNPVKHGLVVRARDWPLSSFDRDVRRGIVPEDWDRAAFERGSGTERRVVGASTHPTLAMGADAIEEEAVVGDHHRRPLHDAGRFNSATSAVRASICRGIVDSAGVRSRLRRTSAMSPLTSVRAF